MLVVDIKKLKAERFRKIDYILASGLINKDVWLAGGSLRTIIDPNETIVDYDLFFRDVHRFETSKVFTPIDIVRDKLIKLGFKCTFECPEGKLYTYELPKNWCIRCGCEQEEYHRAKWARGITFKVQLITEHFYHSPEELLSTFDLSPTYFCTDGERLWTSAKAIKSVVNKECSLLHLTYPVSTFKRIIKYQKKGYNVLPAIQQYVGNLINSNASKFTDESMRVYID